MPRCPYCLVHFQPGEHFCKVCGSTLALFDNVVMTCPRCGVGISHKQKFCHECGVNLKIESLRAQTTMEPEAIPEPAPAPMTYFGEISQWLKLLVIGFLVWAGITVIGGVVLVRWFAGQTPGLPPIVGVPAPSFEAPPQAPAPPVQAPSPPAPIQAPPVPVQTPISPGQTAPSPVQAPPPPTQAPAPPVQAPPPSPQLPTESTAQVPPAPSTPEKPPPPTVEAPSRYPLLYVAVPRLHLRAKPSGGSGVIAALRLNNKVEKLEENPYGWVKVRDLETKQVGWVDRHYLEAAPKGGKKAPLGEEEASGTEKR